MTPGRDPFIDGVRSVAIVRVLLVHLFLWIELPFVGLFSYFMPGMPLVFFISGALASRSLRANGWEERRRFWLDRARRLFLPFWAFSALALTVCLVADFVSDDFRYDYAWERAWAWIVPLAGPRTSPAFDGLTWHLWFMSSLILMLASAPLSVALHRRWRFTGAAAFAVLAVAIELAGVDTFNVVQNLFFFGAVFQLGYGYSDGSFERAPRGALVAAALLLGVFGIAWHRHVSPSTIVNFVRIAHVALGLAFVLLWLALREPAVRLFEQPWFVKLRARVNPRAYTIFLWGPIANDAAARIVEGLGAWKLPAYFALSLVLLAVAMATFGAVEDVAAGRRRVAPRPVLAPADPLRKAA